MAGLKYTDIVEVLRQSNVSISLRHLKRVLKSLGLQRRKHCSATTDVIRYIEGQLTGSGDQHGYR